MATAEKKKKRTKNPFDVDYGSETDKYKWIQTEDEVTVTVPFPDGIEHKSKEVNAIIHSKRLTVGLKGQPPIVDNELTKLVTVDDSYWLLEGASVVVTLIKSNKKEWWASVIPHEAEIDTSKIEGSRHLDSALLSRLRREHEEKMDQEEKEAAEKERQEKSAAEKSDLPELKEDKPEHKPEATQS